MINNKKIKLRTISLVCLIIASLFMSACGRSGKLAYSEKAREWIAACHKSGGISSDESVTSASFFRAGDTNGDWMIIAEARAGLGDNIDKRTYLKNLKKYVSDAYKEEKKLDAYMATEWHRICLALLALGENPRSFGVDSEGKPIDLVGDGIFHWGKETELDYQGSNALIYALLVINAGDYESPADARYTTDSIISKLLMYQMDDGSFGLNMSGGNTDITAMAIQALAPFVDRDKEYQNLSGKKIKVKRAVDSAIDFLSKNQQDGGYFYFQNHCSSDTVSQVILALCSVGIDPTKDERFIKNGGTLVDALISFEIKAGGIDTILEADGGGEKTNILATRQGICALTALSLLEKGNGKFFDFNNKL